MSKPLTIWCNYKLPDALETEFRKSLGVNELVWASDLKASNLAAGGADPLLESADVAFGQPDPQQVIALPNLKWVQLTTAGYTRYDRDDLRAAFKGRGAVMTNSSAVFAEPCAQHVLAFMLAHARQLPASWKDQAGPRVWPTPPLRATCRLLNGQRVLILGFGSIARKLAEYLRPLEVEMIAVRRSVKGDEPIPTIGVDRADELLADADHVVNILPASPATMNFVNAARLAKMKPSAVLYNIGRGDTVDQTALIDALNSNRLAAVYLDVTVPEPLPADHPLWDAPNCHITPHTAGGHHDEQERLVAHFLANLQRFGAGAALHDRIA
jgi:phosphoglycerate dehydrogenase-like enzyme